MSGEFHFIHDYPLFSGLSEAQLRALMGVCREECFAQDTVLFREGEAAQELFVLVEGQVEESFALDGAQVTLRRPAAAGEIIGCPALTPPYVQRCSARSLTNIEVLAIDAPGLRDLFAADCALARTVQGHVIEALLARIGTMRVSVLAAAR